jgi:hypothetical protein
MNEPGMSEDNKTSKQQQTRGHKTHPSLQISRKTKHSYHGMSSSSEEEEITQDVNENKWQQVKNTKRMKVNQPVSHNITLTNKYSQLGIEDDERTTTKDNEYTIPKPPPVFVYGVINYHDMVQNLNSIALAEEYTTKTLANNTIKINCHTPDTYRKLVRYMREKNIVYHTYQLKENRAFRVVIKHLHFSTNPKDIEQELNNAGHRVRNILNSRSRLTKEPLNIFFIDLEPATNNKDVYKLARLQNQSIVVEPPRKTNGIPQCMRCQQYGHTRSYCNKPYVCVKCGGPHSTQSCTKTKDTPAKCVFCAGAHPANYRGCEYYRNLQKQPNNANNRQNFQHTEPFHSQSAQKRPGLSYSEALKGTRNQEPHSTHTGEGREDSSTDLTTTQLLTKVLEDFKAMFHQLTQQNSMILNMLSTLISKIH